MLNKKVVSQCVSSDYCRGWNDAVDAMPRWISVEERLPEAHKNVLVYMTNPIGWWNVNIDWMDEHGWVCSADSEWHTITHWMPLPSTEGLHDN